MTRRLILFRKNLKNLKMFKDLTLTPNDSLKITD